MTTLIETLELVAESKAVCLPTEEVDRLVARFGSRVRGIGRWNKSSDGSIEIPMAVIHEVASEMGEAAWQTAISELRSSDAGQTAADLIDRLASAHDRRLGHVMTRFQESTDPVEVERLQEELRREIFG